MPSVPRALWLMARRHWTIAVNDDRLDEVRWGLSMLCRLPPGELITVLYLLAWIVDGPEASTSGLFSSVQDARMMLWYALEDILVYDNRLPTGGLYLRPPHGGRNNCFQNVLKLPGARLAAECVCAWHHGA